MQAITSARQFDPKNLRDVSVQLIRGLGKNAKLSEFDYETLKKNPKRDVTLPDDRVMIRGE